MATQSRPCTHHTQPMSIAQENSSEVHLGSTSVRPQAGGRGGGGAAVENASHVLCCFGCPPSIAACRHHPTHQPALPCNAGSRQFHPPQHSAAGPACTTTSQLGHRDALYERHERAGNPWKFTRVFTSNDSFHPCTNPIRLDCIWYGSLLSRPSYTNLGLDCRIRGEARVGVGPLSCTNPGLDSRK